MSPGSSRGGTRPLSSGVKLLALLDVIADTTEPVRAADLARHLGTTRAAVHRQLVTLLSAGWLTQTVDGRYALTVRAANLGQTAFRHAGLSDRVAALLAELAEKIGEVASLAVLDGAHARVVERAEPGRALRVTLALGERFPIWSSASGQVLVASADKQTLSQLLDAGVRLPKPAELWQTLADGFACSISSPDEDILAVAVPVGAGRKGITFALSALGPRTRLDVDSAVVALSSTAAQIDQLVTTSRSLAPDID